MNCISIKCRCVKSAACLFLILLIGMYTGLCKFKVHADTDIIDKVICSAAGTIEEYGITAVFSYRNNTSAFINSLMDDFGYKDAKDVTMFKNDYMYRIEFQSGYERGYFESSDRQRDESLITVNIISTDKKSNIRCLKSKFDNILKMQKCRIRYFEYIKARIPDNKDLTMQNTEILNILKECGAANIHMTDISNGCSITAYTKNYTPVKVSGRPVDLTTAVMHYDTGKYIIIGTPIINETY